MDSIKSALREIGRQRQLLTMNLEVLDITDVASGFRRLTLHGHEIDGYCDPRAADAFKVMIPPSTLPTVDRRLLFGTFRVCQPGPGKRIRCSVLSRSGVSIASDVS